MHRSRFAPWSLLRSGVTAVLLGLTLLMSGCLVQSSVPLAPLAPVAADNGLVGSWVKKEKDHAVYLHLGNAGATARLVSVRMHQDGRIEQETFAAGVTTINQQLYLSVELPQDGNKSYLIVKVLRRGDVLEMRAANFKRAAQAVQAGELPGEVKSVSLTPRVLLTADEAKWRQFIGAHDAELFTESQGEFHKLP